MIGREPANERDVRVENRAREELENPPSPNVDIIPTDLYTYAAMIENSANEKQIMELVTAIVENDIITSQTESWNDERIEELRQLGENKIADMISMRLILNEIHDELRKRREGCEQLEKGYEQIRIEFNEGINGIGEKLGTLKNTVDKMKS